MGMQLWRESTCFNCELCRSIVVLFATDHFDHTSILRYVCDKWGLQPLGRRAAVANSFARYIRTDGTRRPMPAHVVPPPETSAVLPDNHHDNALFDFARMLDAKLGVLPQHAAGAAARVVQDGGPTTAPVDLAKQRFRAFLRAGR
jgi:hypothetical protein